MSNVTSTTTQRITRRASLAAIGGSLALGTRAFAAETAPSTIRLAAVSAGFSKPFGLAVIGIVQARKQIEDELKAQNVRVSWTFPDGAGPAINEGIANGQIDFASYGDLPNIIGRAGGLPTRVLASRGAEIIYVGVRTGVKARSIADLKGLRVTLQRGTIMHQAFDRLLGESGLSESDVQLFDLKTPDQAPAIAGGSVDAVVGTVTLLNLRDQGLIRILYTTRGKLTPDGFGAFVVADDFARKYPETTRAVARAYVKAAQWGGEARNRSAVLDIWGQAGTSKATLEESFRGVNLRTQLDPRLDPFYLSTLKGEVAFAEANKLIRTPVDVDAWVDRGPVDTAIRELGLGGYWPVRSSR